MKSSEMFEWHCFVAVELDIAIVGKVCDMPSGGSVALNVCDDWVSAAVLLKFGTTNLDEPLDLIAKVGIPETVTKW